MFDIIFIKNKLKNSISYFNIKSGKAVTKLLGDYSGT